MVLQRAYALIFVLLGGVSIVDALRIASQAREGANFDAIGPDRYLLAIGVLMLAAGLWCLLRPAQAALMPARDLDDDTPEVPITSRLLLTLAMLVGFAALVPVVGFSLACLLFLTAHLRLLSDWPWWKVILMAAAIAVAFHVLFVWLADMPLPKGSIWDW